MTLQQLRYFQALAQSRGWSMTRTAKALFISQPALSYAIAALEKELGAELFHRQGQRLVLTKSGEVFLCRVNDIFARLSDALAEVRSLQDAGSRRLTVGCVPGLTERFLRQLLQECCRGGYDPAGMTLCYRSEPELAGMLERGEADLVLCTAPQKAGIECRPLYTVGLRVFVPRGHPLSRQDAVDPGQLNGSKLVRLAAGSPIQAAADEYLTWHGIVCQTAAVQERVEDAALLVAGGAGVGLLPETAAEVPSLVSVPLTGQAPALTVFLGRKWRPVPAGEVGQLWERLIRCGENWSARGGAGSIPSGKSSA